MSEISREMNSTEKKVLRNQSEEKKIEYHQNWRKDTHKILRKKKTNTIRRRNKRKGN